MRLNCSCFDTELQLKLSQLSKSVNLWRNRKYHWTPSFGPIRSSNNSRTWWKLKWKLWWNMQHNNLKSPKFKNGFLSGDVYIRKKLYISGCVIFIVGKRPGAISLLKLIFLSLSLGWFYSWRISPIFVLGSYSHFKLYVYIWWTKCL